MRLGGRRQSGDEVVVVVMVVAVTAETASTPEAGRTLPGPSLMLATFLLFDLGSGTSLSSGSSVDDLSLLLRLACGGLLLLLAGIASSVCPVFSLSIVSSSVFPIRLRFPNRGFTTSCSSSVSSAGLLFLLLPVSPMLSSPAAAFCSSLIFSISDSTQSTLHCCWSTLALVTSYFPFPRFSSLRASPTSRQRHSASKARYSTYVVPRSCALGSGNNPKGGRTTNPWGSSLPTTSACLSTCCCCSSSP